jgi:hypothetical protein
MLVIYIYMKERRQVMTNSNTIPSKGGIPLTAILFLPITVALTMIRYLQYLHAITPQNGFFVYESGFLTLTNAYYIAFAAAALLMLIVALLDRRANKGILNGSAGKLKDDVAKEVGVILPEVALLLPSQGATPPQKPLRLWNTRLSLPCTIFGAVLFSFCGFSLFLELSRTLGTSDSNWLYPLLLVFAGLGYIFVSFSTISCKKLYGPAALGFLFIAGLCSYLATIEFIERSYTSNISAKLIVLSANLLLTVFFLSCGRIIVRSETRFTSLSATLCGYMTVALIISDFTARLLYFFTADDALRTTLVNFAEINGFELPNPMLVAQAFIALWLLYVLSAKGVQIETIEEVINDDGEEVIGVDTVVEP